MTRRQIVLVVGVAVPIVGILVGLVTGLASAQQHWPGWLEFLRVHPWQSLGVLTVAAVGLATLATIPTAPSLDLQSAADRLATAVGRDWSYEAEWRKVFDPYPLPVRWGPADTDLTAAWPTVVRLAMAGPGRSAKADGRWATGPSDLAGADADLAGILGRVPTGRLIVLGDKGAGKTILLVRLVLDLLSRRQPGEPVPILLPLASWNPIEEDLHSWIVRWLITDRAGLAGVAKGSRVSLARALLEANLILPILDGLDEIPEAVRGSAIARLNDAIRPGQGLILAARTDDYRSAVHPVDGPEVQLTGAAGIELCPLADTVVANYLTDSAGGPIAAARWDPVIASFRSDHPPAVAEALSTPLMAALARVAYNPRPGEDPQDIPLQPAELVDPSRFPTKEAIEDYLYDRFIPASYRQHPDPSHPSRRYSWTGEQAERWLAFLARNLEYGQDGSTDLAWWELPNAAPRHLVGIVLGTEAALVAGLGYPFLGYGLGLTAGLVAGLVTRRWDRFGKQGLIYGLTGGIVGGMVGGLMVLAILGPGARDYRLGTILSAGLGIGIAISLLGRFVSGLVAGFSGTVVVTFYENAPAFESLRTTVGFGLHFMNAFGVGLTALLFVELASRSVPARGLRWSPMWLACGLVCALVLGFITAIQVGWIAGLVVGIVATIASVFAGGIAEPVATDLAGAANPQTVLQRDRATFFACWLGLGAAIGVGTGVAIGLGRNPAGETYGLRYGLVIGVTNILAPGLIFGFVQALWGPFAVARFWLAASRRLPWRFMTFLQDAHADRGVLRQVGAVYQFRHIELQRHLARQGFVKVLGPV